MYVPLAFDRILSIYHDPLSCSISSVVSENVFVRVVEIQVSFEGGDLYECPDE